MGKTKRFVNKTGLPSVLITEGLEVNEPFVLVTYTCGRGDIPKSTTNFLALNHENLLGVASSGHTNWGEDLYARAGKKIAATYKVPLILRFTNSGFPSDIKTFIEGVSLLYGESNVPRAEQ